MTAASARATLLAAVALLGHALPAPAHPGHEGGTHIELDLRIEDTYVTYAAALPGELFLGEVLDADTLVEYASAARERVREHVLDWFERLHPVTIDGLLVQPILEEIRSTVPESWFAVPAAESLIPFATFTVRLRYETKGAPRRVSFVWGHYPPAGGAESPPVVAVLSARGRGKIFTLTEANPELVWPDGVPPVPLAVEPVPRPSVAFPVASLGAVLLALAAASALQRRGRRRGAASTALLGTLAAVALWPLARLDLALPVEGRTRPPQADRAVAIFETLLRNLYRAFDYDDERTIYDTLAQSVAGSELESLYADVYQSLVLREAGGAVTRVESVDVLEARVVEAPANADPGAFGVRARWRVRGIVYHWGHVHRHTNELEAEYLIAPRDGQWKIIASDVMDQRRVGAREPPVLREQWT